MTFEIVVDNLLREIDAGAPGLVEGFYLIGSIALGAYRPGRSDIDFIGVIAQGATETQTAALRNAIERHRTRYPKPLLDGMFVTWDDLAQPKPLSGPRPAVRDSQFSISAGSGIDNPVTWRILADQGVCIRGPQPLRLRVDAADLTAWTLGNLDAYWSPFVARHSYLWSRAGLRSLGPWFTEWTALGVCRLHYTLQTGRITSKNGAARHALKSFGPQWHPIIEEARRLDEGGTPQYGNPFRRRRECLQFARMVVADAKRVGLR